MSKVSFPINPQENDTFIVNNITYQYSGGKWKNVSIGSLLSSVTGYIDTAVATKDNTDEITEGTTNLYYTDARARTSISVSGDLSYNSSTGVIGYTGSAGVTSYNDLTDKPTLFSGSYTDLTDKPTLFSGSYNDLSDKPTIPSLTGYATETYVNTAVANLVDTAPTTLDTLNELAAALGDDPNFATTVSTQIGLKANTDDLATVATSGSYTDLTNKPTIPADQTLSIAGNELSISGGNTVTLPAGVTSYNDLTDKPTIPTNLDSLTDVTITTPTSGQVLQYNGNAWVNDVVSLDSAATITYAPAFKGAFIYQTSTQSLAAANWYQINLTGIEYDTTGGLLTGTSSRFTIPAGVTKVKMSGSVSGDSQTDQFITQIFKNGGGSGSWRGTTDIDIDSPGADQGAAFTAVVEVVEGDYFDLRAYSTLARNTLTTWTWFSIEIVEGSILNSTVSSTIGLETLADVDVTSNAPTNGQVLKYNGSAWVNNTLSDAGIIGTSDTQTLTNKRIDPRNSTTASASSITPDISSYDQYNFTALAETLTINAPTGTPVDGNKLMFRILDDGNAQTLSWNAIYRAIGSTLPTTTTANKTTYVGCIYNSFSTKWDVIAVTTEA